MIETEVKRHIVVFIIWALISIPTIVISYCTREKTVPESTQLNYTTVSIFGLGVITWFVLAAYYFKFGHLENYSANDFDPDITLTMYYIGFKPVFAMAGTLYVIWCACSSISRFVNDRITRPDGLTVFCGLSGIVMLITYYSLGSFSYLTEINLARFLFG